MLRSRLPSAIRRVVWVLVLPAAIAAASIGATAFAQSNTPKRVYGANWKQAFKFDSDYLKQFVYSYYVRPVWIGKTDAFLYSYRTSQGTNYYRVDPKRKSKQPLFDHARVAGDLSAASRIPVDPNHMTLSSLRIDSKGTKLNFVYEKFRYEYDLKKQSLKKLGKSRTSSIYQRSLDRLEQRRKSGQITEKQYQIFKKFYEDRMKRRKTRRPEPVPPESVFEDSPQQKTVKKQSTAKKTTGKKTTKKRTRYSYRAYSADRKRYAYAYQHNLYVATGGRQRTTTKLTSDGAEDYSFGNAGAKMTRPRVYWSKDSKAFYTSRTDSRGMKELWLVSSLSQPRPSLMKYKYAMPGEVKIRKTELFYFHRDSNQLRRVTPKWRDEWYTSIHWGKTGDELRFLRHNRLRRDVELCTLDTRTGGTRCLVAEGFENAIAHYQSARYLKSSNEMIWWSERTGWGHFYLYSRDGKLKNAITSGAWRASRVVSVDEKKRVLYFYGNAREPGANVYHQFLYCVGLDGKNLKLMTPGKAHHGASFSPTKQYIVDNCSAINAVPKTVVRDANGKTVMELEKMDLVKLNKSGWRLPETFIVKAADGVTDLYGNMWKPFDFDPAKKYPIIAYVYPGPQQEGVRHTFTATSSRQQLAQLGFIVIAVGHRGGSPERSKFYHRHSYFNMRDFPLADKKAAIVQLGERFPFIDVERVGIYGHSGGGFLSAAAMLQKPYNEFFKVAVASAGNHDNNIYNNSWAERYHGLKEVPITATAKKTATVGKTATKKKPDLFPQDVDPYDRAQAIRSTKRRPPVVAVKPKRRKAVVAKKPKSQKKTVGKTKSKGGMKKSVAKKSTGKTQKKKTVAKKTPTKFEIKVPTNAELAANLKGRLLLVHGEIDNNVHPANTLRLVDALIKANKRFDMLILPGQRHGFGTATPYFTQRMWEYFAQHLLHDRQNGADIYDKKPQNNQRAGK